MDLPLIFGPVSRRVSIESINLIVFGTHSMFLFYTRQGWYASINSHPLSLSSLLIYGKQDTLYSFDTWAKEILRNKLI